MKALTLVSITFLLVASAKFSQILGNRINSEVSLAKWFETVLELDPVVDTSSGRQEKKERPPYYVQELYDMISEEAEMDEKRQLDWRNDKSLTIQAVHHERNDVLNIENGVDMKFLLKKFWVKENQIARVELVLTFRRELLSSQYNYSVVIACDFDDGAANESRFSVVEMLKERSGFSHNFLVVPITKMVKTYLNSNEHYGKRWHALKVRISVDEVRENGDVHQLPSTVIRRLFHLNNEERSRPILVLFSSDIETSLHHVDHRSKSRLRRTSLLPVSNTGANCALRQWEVNLNGLLARYVVQPEKASINYCAGKCPFPAFDGHWNATTNAVIRNAFVATGGSNAANEIVVPDAVCIPRSLRPLSVIYVENNDHIIKLLDHVVATSCMCA